MAKVLVSLPDDLLQAIEAVVKRRRTTRSAFLRRAARDALAAPDPIVIRGAVSRGRAAIATMRAFESRELVRASRGTRMSGHARAKPGPK